MNSANFNNSNYILNYEDYHTNKLNSKILCFINKIRIGETLLHNK